jgi:hypothetical protein
VNASVDQWKADPTDDNHVELSSELIVSTALQESVLTCLEGRPRTGPAGWNPRREGITTSSPRTSGR